MAQVGLLGLAGALNDHLGQIFFLAFGHPVPCFRGDFLPSWLRQWKLDTRSQFVKNEDRVTDYDGVVDLDDKTISPPTMTYAGVPDNTHRICWKISN